MPVIRDIHLNLKTGEVLRREGFRGHSKVRPEIKSLILELMAGIKKTHLLEPAIAYEIRSITEMSSNQVSLEGDALVHGSLIPSLFAESRELAVVICTIGPRLEKQATDYFDRGEPLRGMLLDGIGSAAVDSLTQEVCKLMAGEAVGVINILGYGQAPGAEPSLVPGGGLGRLPP